MMCSTVTFIILTCVHTILAYSWSNPTSWNTCYSSAAYLTLNVISEEMCVHACQIRERCRGVNYWRVRRRCELMEDGTVALVPPAGHQPCMAVAKTAMSQTSVCGSCGASRICDVESSQCVFAECSGEPVVSNGIFVGNMLRVGSKKKLICDNNYSPEPEEGQATCQPGGGWGTLPQCVWSAECPTPPAVPNALTGAITSVIPGVIAPGTEVTYSCNSGYDAPVYNNNFERICQADLTWSSVAFECLKDCGTPPSEDHTTLDTSGVTLKNTIRTYTCWASYVTAAGSSTFTTMCLDSGQWSAPSGSCIRDCGNPPSVTSASVASGNNYEGSVRTYTCDNRHYVKINGAVTTDTTKDVTCQSNGAWEPSFECIIFCGIPSSEANAQQSSITGHVAPGTTVTYSCLTGYVAPASSNFQRTCGADGDWSAVGFQCLKDCGTPPSENHATVDTSGDTLEGTVRTYTCGANFITAAGSSTFTITCRNTGQWSAPTGSCVRDCGNPPPVTFASVSSGAIHEGSVRTYTCNNRHYIKINGAVTTDTTEDVICQSNGAWDPSFECIIFCDISSSEANAQQSMITSHVAPGATVTYSCLTGYVALAGSNNFQRTCGTDGDWSAVGFQCLKDCGSPSPVAFATVNVGNTYEGSTRTYTCNANYHVKKNGAVSYLTSNDVTCQSSGAWFPAFECVLECPSYAALVDGAPSLADNKITASSYWNNFNPEYAKLGAPSAWGSGDDPAHVNEWIQFDFSTVRLIHSIKTKGHSNPDEWVKAYYVKYNTNCGSTFSHVMEGGNIKTFSGNTDTSSFVTRTFPAPFLARCVRINPRVWKEWPTMKVELYGCSP